MRVIKRLQKCTTSTSCSFGNENREREIPKWLRDREHGNGNETDFLGNGNGKRESKKVVPAGLYHFCMRRAIHRGNLSDVDIKEVIPYRLSYSRYILSILSSPLFSSLYSLYILSSSLIPSLYFLYSSLPSLLFHEWYLWLSLIHIWRCRRRG